MPNHHIEVQMIPVLLYIACQGDNTQPKPIEKSATSTIPIEKITFTKERLRPSDHVLCVDTNNDGVDESLFLHDGQLHTSWIPRPYQVVFRLGYEMSPVWIATGFSKSIAMHRCRSITIPNPRNIGQKRSAQSNHRPQSN